MSKFRKIKEAAEELNLSEKTLWNWRAAGKLTVHTFGRSVRISQAEIDRLVSEGEEPARQSA